MTHRRRFIAFLAACAAIGTLAAAPQPAHARTLKVGSTPTGAPFTFLDTKTNTIEGMMVDVVRAVGREAGFDVVIEPMQFSTLISSLTSKRIDLISAAMLITPERLKVIGFSDRVYSYGEGIVTAKSDTKPYATLDDMAGRTIGVQVGTAYVAPLQAGGRFREVKLYDTTADLMRDANAGRIDFGMLDQPIAANAIGQDRFPNLRVVDTYVPTLKNDVGIGVRRDDAELLQQINAALKKLSADGTIGQIVRKWKL